MFDFISIKKMLGSYAGELKKLRAEIEALEIEREDVLFAPPAQSDVRAAIVGWIESTRNTYQATLKNILTNVAAKRNLIEDPDLFSKWVQATPFVPTENNNGGYDNGKTDRAICGIFGDVLIKSIDATLNQMEWSKDCLTSAERTKRLAVLDKKLEALRADEKNFVSAANDVGVNVESVE